MAIQYSIYFFGLILFFIYILIIVGIVVACGGEICRQQKKPPRVSHILRRPTPSKRMARRTSSRPELKPIQLAMCIDCEATILANTKVCPHCGSQRPICMVCSSLITQDDSVLSCPHCDARAHRIHFLEYLKVKGTCPNCQNSLDINNLVESNRPSFPSLISYSPQHLCMLCHRAIGTSDELLQCPRCKGKAHRIHLLEYLKIKGTCPNCGMELNPHELLNP